MQTKEKLLKGEKRVALDDVLFEVETKPVFAGIMDTQEVIQEAEQIMRQQAVCVKQTGRPLGIVSDSYVLIPNTQIYEKVKPMMTKTMEIETYANWNQGIFKFLITDKGQEIAVKGTQDLMHPRVMITNSLSGRAGIRVNVGAFRIVCSNGNWIGQKMDFEMVRHTGGADDKLNQFLDTAFQNFKDQGQFDKWARWAQENWMGASNLEENKYLTKGVREVLINNVGNTKWVAFNEITRELSKKGYIGRSIIVQKHVEDVLN